MTYPHMYLSLPPSCLPMIQKSPGPSPPLRTVLTYKLIFKHCNNGALTQASGLMLCMKSMLLRFHNPSTPVSNFDYILNNSIIPHVSNGRDLGVIFSETLSWTDHYKLISQRAYSQLNLLKRVFAEACPSSVKRTLYLTLVCSQLTYCSQVWRPVLVKDIETLEKIQRRATKYIVSDSSLDYFGRLVSLQLLPLMYFYELLDLLLLIQSLKSPDSSFDIKNYITFSSHGTRSGSCSKILLSHNSTNRSRHFYFYGVARLWTHYLT